MQYNYVELYNKNAAFYNANEGRKWALRIADPLLTLLIAAAYAATWVYGIFWGEFSPKNLTKLFCIPVLALFLVSVLRAVFARPRPYAQAGAQIMPLKKRKGKDDDSFPSRHLACAAAIALTVCSVLPAVGGILLVLTALLGYTRFALGLHYPSDLVGGVAVGLLITGFYAVLEVIFTFLA